MGGIFSSASANEPHFQDYEDKSAIPPGSSTGALAPAEVNQDGGMYTEFMERVVVFPHKDSTCLVAYGGTPDRDSDPGEPNPYAARAAEIYEYFLHAANGVDNAAEVGGNLHARIVK
jgi:hypothetical protein